MEQERNVRLTSTEIGCLWTSYVNDSMARCMLGYFRHVAEDSEVRAVMDFAYQMAEKHVERLAALFAAERFPLPQGFTDEDVNVGAKRLYSDNFFLYYVKNMSRVGLATYAMTYVMASRADVRSYFRDCVQATAELDQRVTSALQSKGIYTRPPYLEIPNGVDFVTSKSFLSGGFFGFRDKRPLTAIEISHLFANAETNGLGHSLLLGMSQVAHSKELRQYLVRGVEIASKHFKVFSDILHKENLPVPMTWDTDVTDSTEAPFSDKLILFQISLLVAAGTGNYGVAAAASPRKDVAFNYVRLAAEIASYTEDGAKLMIENGWLEEPPLTVDREELAKV